MDTIDTAQKLKKFIDMQSLTTELEAIEFWIEALESCQTRDEKILAVLHKMRNRCKILKRDINDAKRML